MAFKIDASDGATSEPSRGAASSLKFFSDALRTRVSAWWLNMVQNEICSAVTKFGLTLDKNSDNQLGLAIQAGIDASIAVAKSDTQYVDMTGGTGTLLLTQSTDGDKEYTISQFDNASSTLDTDEIRALHVQLTLNGNEGLAGEIYATYGNVDDVNIGTFTVAETGSGYAFGTVIMMAVIPIQKGQSLVTITNGGNYPRSFTIIGVTERVAG